MQLLIERMNPDNFKQLIEEAEGKPKIYWLNGPIIMEEEKNNNGRIYRHNIVEREVQKLMPKIKINKLAGELNHPQSPEINPERISHYITALEKDGNIWMGRVKVASTPLGGVVKNLMDDKYPLGMSTRGLGTVGSDGYVMEDFRMITADIIDAPSIGKYMDPILESIRYKMLDDGTIVKGDSKTEQAVEVLEKKIETLPKVDVEKYLVGAIQEFINTIAPNSNKL